MRNKNRRRKIIILITIILIIIITTIMCIARTLIINNQIKSEGYFSTANASSELVASYIKKGITIGGITGTLEVLDTTDATATAGEIINGYTAYANGEKLTGTYTPLDTSDATATAEQILNGYTAYVNGSKITGTYQGKTLKTKQITQSTGYVSDYEWKTFTFTLPANTVGIIGFSQTGSWLSTGNWSINGNTLSVAFWTGSQGQSWSCTLTVQYLE